jgi:hypothetical protein
MRRCTVARKVDGYLGNEERLALSMDEFGR